ncbi:hypothetical protein HBO32_31700 [Pseudomonas nitroreducens]|uniref:hypothetical protein n=1 Tax=Pseudomonas nitroreducens TaxID=46680 RepID=UPI001473E644|nr:hypothetical protein [Pseudomonas nitroreducens]NMZ77662.1 hypothetical protein [Pseudomonas nitroreducens]NMZ77666.1 hypothetical protein [Pseudomonas nitroreducens]
MGLQDREWFQEARKPKAKAKAAPAPKPAKPALKEPTWAVVIAVVCIAIAVIVWL